MLVLVDIGIEVGTARVDRDLFQQMRFGELVQRVVNGGKRNPHTCPVGLCVEGFGGQVAILVLEQQAGQRHPLLGRPQSRGPQTLCGLSIPLFQDWAGATHLSEPYAFPNHCG